MKRYLFCATSDLKKDIFESVDGVIMGEIKFLQCDILSPSMVIKYVEDKFFDVNYEPDHQDDSDFCYLLFVENKSFYLRSSAFYGGFSLELIEVGKE
jgi:hypothetical protein